MAKAQRSGRIGREQGPVEHGGVVGDDHRAPSGRPGEILEALDLDAIEQAEKPARQIGDEFLRQQLADVGGGDRIGKAGQQEEAADREPCGNQGEGERRSPPS